ncbi:uncharacterized protein LOC124536237 [Vanessa cardui]|uniref:uncharacterized protein LOC124536237 n=1 Tax=Vanessa cardui TaxID=171605 RepID=UPI001F147B2F|nr:uncharacterized protein LOC124536237 [Vanessa cardui]
MNNSINLKRNHIKSLTNLVDIFAPRKFHNVYHCQNAKTVYATQNSRDCCNYNNKRNPNSYESTFVETPFVTSEKYHALNKNSSDRSVIRSTSTFFYDLDTIIKRHSYHCIPQLAVLSNNINVSDKNNLSGFSGKSEAIVQKCSTLIQPKLRLQDSFNINVKKVKKKNLNKPNLPSDICLNDNDDAYYDAGLFARRKHDRKQKFWSYSKYHTDYDKPEQKEKISKKKDRGKRIEDPCPCQLFSYACPCTDKKSLTELAKNNKCLTVVDQITSTAKFASDQIKQNKSGKLKVSKCDQNHGSKPINFNGPETIEKGDMEPKTLPSQNVVSTPRINYIKVKSKSKKHIICPKCNEKVEILSTTEEEDCVKPNNTPLNENNNLQENLIKKENNDICNHSPPCELIPICQILPTETYTNSKCVANVSTIKNNTKMIRITKACRHHPPCTVVPSCQRANVLKNNCEFVPPCLHHPRCINLPLCVPFAKNFYYDEILNKNEEIISTDCSPQQRYMSAYQGESLISTKDQHYNTTQNTCEYFSEYSPRFALNPKMTCIPPTLSPYFPSPMPCKCCKASKSCQYDCIDCKCIPNIDLKDKPSVDAIVYIRDVGCQFRNRTFSPQDSLLYSKTSSHSFNLKSISKTAKYSNHFHTLRYEDKYTHPFSGEEMSMSIFTTSSLEIDADCPSHGKQTGRVYTALSPKPTASPFVTVPTSKPCTNQVLAYYLPASNRTRQKVTKNDKINSLSHVNVSKTKYRRSILKGKRKNVFNVRRHKKSSPSSKYGWHSSS